jgi:hypothetical protein
VEGVVGPGRGQDDVGVGRGIEEVRADVEGGGQEHVARHEHDHEVDRAGHVGLVVAPRQRRGVRRHGAGVLRQLDRARLVVLATAGPQVRVQRRLGIDDHAATVGEAHHDVGPARAIRAGVGALLDEVGVRDHARLLQHPTQLHLAPGAPHLVVPQRARQPPCLGADLLVGATQAADGLAQHGRLALALLLEVGETSGVLLELGDHGVALGPPVQLRGLLEGAVAGLRQRQELLGLLCHGLARGGPEQVEQPLVRTGRRAGACQLLTEPGDPLGRPRRAHEQTQRRRHDRHDHHHHDRRHRHVHPPRTSGIGSTPPREIMPTGCDTGRGARRR